MHPLAGSADFIISYYLGQQVGTGDMDFHVVKHVRNFEHAVPEDDDRCQSYAMFVRLAKERAKARCSPWL